MGRREGERKEKEDKIDGEKVGRRKWEGGKKYSGSLISFEKI